MSPPPGLPFMLPEGITQALQVGWSPTNLLSYHTYELNRQPALHDKPKGTVVALIHW